MRAGSKLENETPMRGVKVVHFSNKSKISQASRTRTCGHCGGSFTGRSERVYCSRSCMGKARRVRVDLTCIVCGKSFEVQKSVERKRGCCGSAECRHAIRIDIRRRAAYRLPDGRLISDAAAEIGCSISTIYNNLKNGRRWDDVRKTPVGEAMHNAVLTNFQAREIKRELKSFNELPNGLITDLARRYCVGTGTIASIASGRTWGHVSVDIELQEDIAGSDR